MDVLSAGARTPAQAPSYLSEGTAALTACGFTAFCAAFENLLVQGESALVLVSGAAGMGKSVLLGEFSSLGRRAGWEAHEVAASQLGSYSVAEPAVLTVDDISRVHESSLVEALSVFKEEAASRRPTLLVLAVRSSDLAQMPQLQSFCQEAGHVFALGAMSRSQVEGEVRSALGEGTCCLEIFNRLVQETAGHPLMLRFMLEQLKSCAEITDQKATHVVETARRKMSDLVWAPMLAELSGGDLAFLEAMALDDEPSRMQHISHRLGKNPQYTGVYRNRLVAAEIIRAASYGKVTFVTPLLRHYLRQLIAQRMENQF